MLATTIRGRGSRVVFVHGFTQTGRAWDRLSAVLADIPYELLCPDLPGHAGSAEIAADLPATADQVAEVGGPAVYVGYSLGGRVCLHVALQHPELVQKLVLISATAGIEDEAEREQRRQADGALADRLDPDGVDEPAGSPAERARLAAFLDDWLAGPLFKRLGKSRAGLDDRMRNTCAGLASSLRLAGTGTQADLWGRLAELSMPTLVVAGAEDEKFRGLALRLAEGIGDNARLEILKRAGHSVPAEAPNAFRDLLIEFLSGHGHPAPGAAVPETTP